MGLEGQCHLSFDEADKPVVPLGPRESMHAQGFGTIYSTIPGLVVQAIGGDLG